MYFPFWELRKGPGRSTGIRGRNCAASPFRKPDGCRAQASAEISGIGAPKQRNSSCSLHPEQESIHLFSSVMTLACSKRREANAA